jgi:hypothetical protein
MAALSELLDRSVFHSVTVSTLVYVPVDGLVWGQVSRQQSTGIVSMHDKHWDTTVPGTNPPKTSKWAGRRRLRPRNLLSEALDGGSFEKCLQRKLGAKLLFKTCPCPDHHNGGGPVRKQVIVCAKAPDA